MEPASRVELEKAVGLEVQGFRVVGGEEEKGLVKAIGVAGEGE